MRIEYSKRFMKEYKKYPLNIQRAFKNRLNLLLKNKYHPLLNNHALTGILQNYRSINITGDWRALFQEFNSGNTIYFAVLGTHSKLYK